MRGMRAVLLGLVLVVGCGPAPKSSPVVQRPQPTVVEANVDWKVDRFCSISNEGSLQNIQVRTVFEGKDTIVGCPDFGDCKVGTVFPNKYFMSVMCNRSGYNGSWSEWDCEMIVLNLAEIERRELELMTAQTVAPAVKEFSVELGEVRLGPVYGGVDLVVSGMKPMKDKRYA